MTTAGNNHGVYQSMLADRRPTYYVDTPCLTRHVVIRPNELTDPITGASDQYGVRLERLLSEINNYIKLVRSQGPVSDRAYDLRTEFDPKKPFPIPSLDGRKSRYESVYFDFRREGVPFELIVDCHTEYFCCSFRSYPTLADTPNTELLDILRYLALLQSEGTKSPDLSLDEGRINDTISKLYPHFWSEHLPGQFDPCSFFGGDRGHTVLAVFTGMVLRLADSEQIFEREKELANEFLLGNTPDTAQPVVKNQILDTSEGGAEIWMKGTSPKEALSKLTKLLNQGAPVFRRLLGYDQDSRKIDDHFGGNAVLCGCLEGLAIYGASFGVRSEKSTWNDVQFFVLYAGPSRNQLARLVRRLHTCGENRVMALVDFESVRLAGHDLRAIDNELDKLLTERRVGLASITELRMRVAKAGKIVRGGLGHRVSRSDYYFSELQTRCKDLRIERLYGWQTYDEYVQRIFGPQAETFVRIGRAFKDIENRLNQSDEIITAHVATDLQKFGLPIAAFGFVELITEFAIKNANDSLEQPLAFAGFLVALASALCVYIYYQSADQNRHKGKS